MIIRKPAFDGFSFVKFYAKNTTSGIDIGYKKEPKTMVHTEKDIQKLLQYKKKKQEGTAQFCVEKGEILNG